MRKRSQITTIGSSVMDIMYYTDEGRTLKNPDDITCCELLAFEKAAKISAKKMEYTYGGGAANTACTFARFGLRPKILSAIGDDAIGEECMHNFVRQSVDTSLLQEISNQKTGLSFIVTDIKSYDHVIFVYRGASSDLKLSPKILAKVKTPWVYATSFSGSWRKNLDALFTHTNKKGIRVAWNPGSEQIKAGARALKKYLLRTEVLLLNMDEALELYISSSKSGKALPVRSLIKKIYALGSNSVVITDGHKGAYFFDGDKVIYQQAKKCKVVNKTGAGDAFGAGFIGGLIKYEDTKRALKIGSYNSSSVICKVGAQIGILNNSIISKIR